MIEIRETINTEMKGVTPSRHIHHARVMELYLEIVTSAMKNFKNKKNIIYMAHKLHNPLPNKDL